MKDYLQKTFEYNDWAIQQILRMLPGVSEKKEIVKLLSHLITAQDKWYNRVVPEKDDKSLAWFGPEYGVDELSAKWSESIGRWKNLVRKCGSHELESPIRFKRQPDDKTMNLSLEDLMLQLNYHCIHHRAQINTLMSRQGVKPPATDYIFTVLKEE